MPAEGLTSAVPWPIHQQRPIAFPKAVAAKHLRKVSAVFASPHSYLFVYCKRLLDPQLQSSKVVTVKEQEESHLLTTDLPGHCCYWEKKRTGSRSPCLVPLLHSYLWVTIDITGVSPNFTPVWGAGWIISDHFLLGWTWSGVHQEKASIPLEPSPPPCQASSWQKQLGASGLSKRPTSAGQPQLSATLLSATKLEMFLLSQVMP